MLFTDLVDEDCIHLGGVGLLMVMARAKASNAVAFYRFQYTEYMLKHHPTEIRSILTLQKRHCKGVCFLHQFVWLDIGWNECQDGCAKSAGILSQIKISNWPRDLISGYAYFFFVCIISFGRLLRHYWSKEFGRGFCVAWRILARPRWPVYCRSLTGKRTRYHAFTCLWRFLRQLFVSDETRYERGFLRTTSNENWIDLLHPATKKVSLDTVYVVPLIFIL